MQMFIKNIWFDPKNEDTLTLLLQDDEEFTMVDFKIINYSRNQDDRINEYVILFYFLYRYIKERGSIDRLKGGSEVDNCCISTDLSHAYFTIHKKNKEIGA